MQDFASALGAGGGAPADAGPPDTGPPDTGGGEDFQSSQEALQVAEEALQAFIRMDPDHADRAIAAQCLQNVLKLQASQQQGAQDGNLASLQRALGAGPGGAPPAGGPPPPGGGGY